MKINFLKNSRIYISNTYQISFSTIGKKVTNSYYIFAMLIAFFFMFGVNLYFGFLVTAITFLYGFWKSFNKASYPLFKLVIIIFIFFNLLTGICYLFNRMPIQIYLSEIQLQLLPIFFFFIGNDENEIDRGFYKSMLIGSIFMFLVGIYLYFSMPKWYIDWKVEGLSDWVGKDNADFVTSTTGLSSFFYTPYYTGYFSVFALIYIISLIFEKGPKLLYLLMFLITLLILALAQMRVAWIVGFFIFFVSIFYGVFKKKKAGYYLMFILIFMVSSILFFLFKNREYTIILDLIVSRFDSLNSAASDRSNTWSFAISNLLDLLMGHGLGTASHVANSFGYPAITDGNYFKMFFELGLVGTFLLAVIMILTLIRGLKFFKYLYVELGITFFITIACIGANPFSMPLIIAIYWFSVGRIWNFAYLKSIKSPFD